MVAGKLPCRAVSLMKPKASIAEQESLALPPAAWKAARLLYLAGTSPTHWTLRVGHEIVGAVVS